MIFKPWLTLLCLLAFTGMPALGEEDSCACENTDATLAEIKELRQDINLLNLINGLNLTREQIQVILKEARKVKADLEPVTRKARKTDDLAAEELEILKAVRKDLYKEGDVSPTLKARYDVVSRKKTDRISPWKLRPQAAKRVQKSAASVGEALTQAQAKILTEYVPCLIPPKDLKNPVRVGQAGTSGQVAQFLTYVRNLPEPVFANRLESIVEDAVKGMELHAGALEEDARIDYTEKIMDVCCRGRRMGDVEFELNKDSLAKELALQDRVADLQKSLSHMGVARYQLEGKITQFLLVPRIIPILERRLDQSKAAVKR